MSAGGARLAPADDLEPPFDTSLWETRRRRAAEGGAATGRSLRGVEASPLGRSRDDPLGLSDTFRTAPDEEKVTFPPTP
jgi:hypothetical protein